LIFYLSFLVFLESREDKKTKEASKSRNHVLGSNFKENP